MIVLRTLLAEYRVAAAELPLSVVLGDRTAGSVVVVPGRARWAAAAAAAVLDGARAVVVARPGPAPDADLASLADAPVPIVLERPRLRQDTIELVGDSPVARYRTADVAASRAALPAVMRDAVGWLRILSASTLTLAETGRTASGSLALLVPDDGVPALLAATTLVGPGGGGRLRVHSLGEERVEVTVDEAVSSTRVEVTTEAGSVRRPRSHETSERLAVRRAVDAVDRGVLVPDVAELRHDQGLASAILGSVPG